MLVMSFGNENGASIYRIDPAGYSRGPEVGYPLFLARCSGVLSLKIPTGELYGIKHQQ